MTYDNLNRSLGLCVLFCVQVASTLQGVQQEKVSLLLHEEPKTPKCFAEGRKDFTCFWEEDEERAGPVEEYSFNYNYQNENSSRCLVKAFPTAGGKRLYICQLDRTQMFVQLDIQVLRDGVQIHNRSLFIEMYFLLDPPDNVTVSRTEQPGQLRVSWVPPPLKYMVDSMMYEVSYDVADSDMGQVEEVRASSELVLRGLQPGSRYKVRVRVKLDGISYSGYWSVWTDPVFMETLPTEVDPLIVSLSVVISLILTLLSIIVVLSHRRFIVKKIWPVIPKPESKFQGLFTVYGGDFQEWLGQTNGNVWTSPAFFYSEECSSTLEVLSELSLCPTLPSPALPPKASSLAVAMHGEEDEEKRLRKVDAASTEGWREVPHNHWLMEQLQALHQRPVPCSQSSLLESQDAYVTLNGNNYRRDEHLDDILQENGPLEVLFTSRTASAESHSDLGSLQQSSGSGRLSSQCSFEYPNHTWPPKGPGYTYMAVADSGVSMDYSPMSSSRIDDIGKMVTYINDYENESPANRRHLLMRQQAIHYGC